MIQKLSLWLTTFALIICSCSTDDEDCDSFFTCDTEPPVEGSMKIKITINAENPSVPVAIYLDDIEDSVLVYQDTLTENYHEESLDIDEFYSVTGTYKKGAKTIIAIDGDRVRTKSKDKCGYTCYSVKNGKVDLRIE
jgi:hypothetical protein